MFGLGSDAVTLIRRVRALAALGLVVVAVGGLTMAACGDDDAPGNGPTLPPMQTTTPPVAVTVAADTTLPQYYEVKRGDTLTEIAVAYGIPVAAIMELNGMTDPNAIQAGQILAIPPRSIVATALPATVPGQTAPTLAPTTTLVAATTVA